MDEINLFFHIYDFHKRSNVQFKLTYSWTEMNKNDVVTHKTTLFSNIRTNIRARKKNNHFTCDSNYAFLQYNKIADTHSRAAISRAAIYKHERFSD